MITSSPPISVTGTVQNNSSGHGHGPVLVVVSEFERAQFKVDTALAPIINADIHIQNCDSLSHTEWAQLLENIRPEVLMVGWAVPLLPAGYLDHERCPVKYISFFTGSVRRLVTRAFIERGGIVSNWGDAAAPAVAEHALLLLLATLRRLPEWRPFIDLPPAKQNLHPLPIATRTLYGKTVSLHGFGLIARQIIRVLAPFSVKVRAYSEGVPPAFMQSHGAEPVSSLSELFDTAEIFVECEALTSRSVGSVTAALIEQLPADAIFINVGRGAVVDETALARRAATGNLWLGLDVFAVEPLSEHSPLRLLPNVILSPHIAGGTRDQLPDLGTRAAENLRRYLASEPVLQPVTLDTFDRST